MKARRGLRAGLTLVCLLALVLTGTVGAAAKTLPGASQSKIVLVDEKDTAVPSLVAVRGGTITTPDALDWEDGGVHGKAIHLNGAGDYLEYPNSAFCSGEISVVGFVNWFGGVTDNPQSELNQQLFTVFRDAENYFTLNLHGYRDNVMEGEDGTAYRIDGVTLEYKISGSSGKHVEAYNLTSGGVDYAIRKNEWTHLTITISRKAIKLYVNGVHWFEEPLKDASTLLSANGVRIGGTVGDTPYTLSALVDDVAVFRGILDKESIAYLASGAGLDFSPPKEKTAESDENGNGESSAQADGDTFQEENQSGLFADISIPVFTWYVLGGLLVLFVILTIALNKHEANRKKEENQ